MKIEPAKEQLRALDPGEEHSLGTKKNNDEDNAGGSLPKSPANPPEESDADHTDRDLQ